MAEMISKKCLSCKTGIEVRLADHKRGWGNYCSKSCKAKKQTKDTGIASPHFKAEGRTVQQMKSGHYAKSQFSGRRHDGRSEMKHKTCHLCGAPAVNGVRSPFGGDGGIEWLCERHMDDTHPFDGDNFNYT